MTNVWDVQQYAWAKQVIETNSNWDPTAIRYVGGFDISFDKINADRACACLIVCNYTDLSIVYKDTQIITLDIPYISGYLGFREVPHYLQLLDRLRATEPNKMPDVILIDGFGILHPRGAGSATQLGILVDIPTIGVGKTLIEIDGLNARTASNDLLCGNSGRIWGATLHHKRPIYVSIGHRVDLETAIYIVKHCCRYRIPEPIRQADILSKLPLYK